jgi:hypothetical protein
MTKKFRVLRGISVFYKVLSVLVVAGFVLVFGCNVITSASSMTVGEFPVYFLASLIPGLILAVGLFAVGEIIELFISIEENMRATRIAVMHLAKNDPALSGERGPSRVIRETKITGDQ